MGVRSRYAADLPADPDIHWAISHEPAVNAQATISRPAGAAGVRHVCTSITATIASNGAVTVSVRTARLRDGLTGAGTILWSGRLSLIATAGDHALLAISGLSIPGTAATAMTLEFDAAAGLNTFESVSLTGFSVEE